MAGSDVFTLPSILGHTTLDMTRRYVVLASSHISASHRRFSPMNTMAVAALSARHLGAGGMETFGRKRMGR